jgi:hypothetical protein
MPRAIKPTTSISNSEYEGHFPAKHTTTNKEVMNGQLNAETPMITNTLPMYSQPPEPP